MANFVRRTTLTINGKRSNVVGSTVDTEVYHGNELDNDGLYDLIETMKRNITTLQGYFTSGSAKTSEKFKTARTISLTGAITGSVLFDGSANANINTTASNIPASAITGTLSSSHIGAHNHTWGTVLEKPTSFPPSAHTHVWANISDRPTTWAWSSISGKPSSYTASAHTHKGGDINSAVSQAAVASSIGMNSSYSYPMSITNIESSGSAIYLLGTDVAGDDFYFVNIDDFDLDVNITGRAYNASYASRLTSGFTISINGTSKKLYGNGDSASFTISTGGGLYTASPDTRYSPRGSSGDYQYFLSSVPTSVGEYFIKFTLSTLKPNVFLNNKRVTFKGQSNLCQSCASIDNESPHRCGRGFAAHQIYKIVCNGSTYNITTEV